MIINSKGEYNDQTTATQAWKILKGTPELGGEHIQRNILSKMILQIEDHFFFHAGSRRIAAVENNQ